MGKGISLFGRRRTRDLASEEKTTVAAKKDELIALKLQEMNNAASVSGSLQELPIDKVHPDLNQPRKTFRNIESLARSIAEKGVIQPVIVSKKDTQGFYKIIAGERRYLASVKAGLQSISCIVRDETDANILLLQLLENDQRENVSPLEEADAIKRLIDDMDLSKLQIAKELGRDASWVSIRLGLQDASQEIKSLVKDGFIEDIRTLHELRMYEKEDAASALKLMMLIRNNQVAGSYREAISKARLSHKRIARGKPKITASQQITKLENLGDKLVVHLKGQRRPKEFRIDKSTLTRFLADITGE